MWLKIRDRQGVTLPSMQNTMEITQNIDYKIVYISETCISWEGLGEFSGWGMCCGFATEAEAIADAKANLEY